MRTLNRLKILSVELRDLDLKNVKRNKKTDRKVDNSTSHHRLQEIWREMDAGDEIPLYKDIH